MIVLYIFVKISYQRIEEDLSISNSELVSWIPSWTDSHLANLSDHNKMINCCTIVVSFE